jgi:hypothetical protein
MIIQKKMNEKLIKQRTQQNEKEGGTGSKLTDNKKKQVAAKDGSTGTKKAAANQSVNGGNVSALD